MHLSLAADLYDVAADADKGEFLTAAAHLQHAITQNIIGWVVHAGACRPHQGGRRSRPLRRGLSQEHRFGLPPLFRCMAQISRAMDPHTRQVRTIVDDLKRKIPGMSKTLWPRRDVWGEEIPPSLGRRRVGQRSTCRGSARTRLRRQRSSARFATSS
jgi:hypothetical protein